MFYIYNTGTLTVPANSIFSASAALWYVDRHIQFDRLTLDVDPGIGSRNNILINWKKPYAFYNYFDAPVPVDHIYGTPQRPYILDEIVDIEKDYLKMDIYNNNANPINISVAFLGRINGTSHDDRPAKIDKNKKNKYSFPIRNSIGNANVPVNGQVVLLAPPIGSTYSTGTLYVNNNLSDFFEINKLLEWLNIPYDVELDIYLQNVSDKITRNFILARQLFGNADYPFVLTDPLIIQRNENLLMDFRHQTPAPTAPFPVSFTFNGFMYDGRK